MSVTVEVLHVRDCPNLAPMLQRLREVTDLPVTTREVTTDVAAAAAGMRGSPTLLVGGRDPFPASDGDCGLSCRLYRDEHDRVVAVPSLIQLREVLTAAAAGRSALSQHGPADGAAPPPGALSAWRTRALPVDPVEKAVHHAILRTFATTGRPPALSDLDPIAAEATRDTASVVAALHDLDAIRLAPTGQIAVAYPFSAAPTRHRVRIGGRTGESTSTFTDAYAMCAIDALGIAAMLGQDTQIDSVDATTGHSVTVTMTAGNARWDPPSAVVFLGADAGGGPSADCCCQHLNFFTDEASASTWARAHPEVPGQILTQPEAETLGSQLFG